MTTNFRNLSRYDMLDLVKMCWKIARDFWYIWEQTGIMLLGRGWGKAVRFFQKYWRNVVNGWESCEMYDCYLDLGMRSQTWQVWNFFQTQRSEPAATSHAIVFGTASVRYTVLFIRDGISSFLGSIAMRREKQQTPMFQTFFDKRDDSEMILS